jgi:hypothetical protein
MASRFLGQFKTFFLHIDLSLACKEQDGGAFCSMGIMSALSIRPKFLQDVTTRRLSRDITAMITYQLEESGLAASVSGWTQTSSNFTALASPIPS